ncbi:MAG: hypothetical protein LUE12_03090 [Ruminococcus sp.]|nr:hypothetical protein [Ruminococcus sp.]
MSMGTSAYSGTISLRYVSGASSSNKLTNSWTYYTTKTTQTMTISSLRKTSSSSGYTVFNPMGISGSSTSAATFTKSGVKTGVQITANAKLTNYASSSYVYASGSVSG